MPPLPDAVGVLRVAVLGTIGDDTDVINRFHMYYGGTPPTDAQLNTLAAAVLVAWGAYVSPMQGTSYTTNSCEIVDLSTPSSAVGSHSASNPGTRGGTGPVPATCAVVQLKVARRYRGGHARMYLFAGIDTDLASDQVYTGTFIADLTTAMTDFFAAVAGDGWTAALLTGPVNLSYFEGFTNVLYPSGRYRAVPKLRATPLVDTIVSYGVNPNIGSQRRRNLQKR